MKQTVWLSWEVRHPAAPGRTTILVVQSGGPGFVRAESTPFACGRDEAQPSRNGWKTAPVRHVARLEAAPPRRGE